MVTSRSPSCASSCSTNFSTTLAMISGERCANVMMASSRLRNSGANMPVDRLDVVALALDAGEAIGRLRQVGGAGIGGHDQDDVAEVDLLAVVVGELAVIHDLQQHVEQVRMRLLDLVEQQHAVRMLVDAVGQKPALVEADIAGRRADQPRDGVALHVFRHVEADQLDAERGGELLGHLGLADAGRPGEQVAADRLLRLAQAGAGELDRGDERLDRLVLAVDDASSASRRDAAAPPRRPSTRSSAGCAPWWRSWSRFP